MASANAQEIEGWNGPVGQAWASFHNQLDRQIAPLGRVAMEAAGIGPGQRVLDIGCGCGETTLEIARRIGTGEATGVDISAMLLQLAGQAAKAVGAVNVQFLKADAQTDDLGQGVFDVVFSRFGVMFFDDPAKAFGNIRRALKPGGRLGFVCWRSPAENLYLTAAMGAARSVLPPSPPATPNAPGPFGLADGERTRAILAEAGFADTAVEPFAQPIGDSDLEATVAQALNMGPLGSALRETNADDALRAKAADAVRGAYRPYLGADGKVRLPSAVWIVSARNP